MARHIGSGKYMLNACPICGHKNHFVIYANTNSFYSFSNCCKGGTLVDWLMQYYDISKNEAIKQLCGSLESISYKMKQEREKIKVQLEREKQYINAKFDLLCRLYKIFRDAVQEYKKNNQDFRHPDYQWLLFNFDFFDRKSNKFINVDFEGQKQLLSSIISDYDMEYKNFLSFINTLLS